MKQARIIVLMFIVMALFAAACDSPAPEPIVLPTTIPSPTPPPVPTRPPNVDSPEADDDLQITPAATATSGEEATILYSSTRDGVMGLYLLTADGVFTAPLTPGDDTLRHVVWPAVSPDGDQIAFASVQGSVAMRPNGIFISDIDGSEPVQLTLGEGTHPRWSPDGQQIAYTCEGGKDVCIINADGSERENLTVDNELTDRYPDWTPDGRVVFMSNRDVGGPGFSEIYIMDADGTNVTRLTTDGNAYNAYPRVSGDGTRIVYTSDRDVEVGAELYTMSIDGTDTQRVTEDDVWNQTPAWSADGTNILYAAPTLDGGIDLFTVPSDGGAGVRLTGHEAEDGGLRFGHTVLPEPVLRDNFEREGERLAAVDKPRGSSPVSNAIVFATNNNNCADCLETGIYTVSFDGANLIKLPLQGFYPAWDPDFGRISYVHNGELWLANADGSDPVQVTQAYVGITAARWSQRGDLVAADCTPYGQHDVCLVDMTDGSVRNITVENTFDSGVSYPSWFGDEVIVGDRIINLEGAPVDSLPAAGWISPDNRFVATVIDNQIALLPLSGNDPTVITDDGLEKGFPRWGPNSDLIAYLASPGDGRVYLWIARADGSSAYQLVEQPISAGDAKTYWGVNWAP